MRALLLLVTACAPTETLGETLWTRPEVESFGMVAPGGQLVLQGSSLRVIAAGGTFGWEVPCACSASLLDGDGNVYILTGQENTRTLQRLAGADGALEWSRTLTLPAYSPHLAIDTEGSIWWFVTPMAPLDFGGGALEAPAGGSAFGRFRTSDGSYVASGTLDFVVGGARRQPDGGLVVTNARTSELLAIDAAGVTRWRSIPEVRTFVTHADGEVTVLQFVERDAGEGLYDVVHLDASGSERWRKRGFGNGERMIALPSGGVLVSGEDSLAGNRSFDAGFLALYDARGELRRENFEAETVVLFSGSANDSYRLFRRSEHDFMGEIVARSVP